jgi:hypothetical protein
VIPFTVSIRNSVLICNGSKATRGPNAMNEMTLDQSDAEFFTYEVSDEALEAAAGYLERGKANTFTQWMCTAVFFCPGP